MGWAPLLALALSTTSPPATLLAAEPDALDAGAASSSPSRAPEASSERSAPLTEDRGEALEPGAAPDDGRTGASEPDGRAGADAPPSRAVPPERSATAPPVQEVGAAPSIEDRVEALERRVSEVEVVAEASRTRSFVKGWLTGVGDVDFYSQKHRVVVGLKLFPVKTTNLEGGTDTTYFVSAIPRVDLRFGKLYAALEVPLAFELFHLSSANGPIPISGDSFDQVGSFAGFQWDETSEYAQVIRYLRYGTKEEDIYLNVSKVSAASVGHGTLLRRYNPNIDRNHARVSAQLDKGFESGGLEFYTNDVMGYGIIGGLAYAKPLAPFWPKHLQARSTSVGFSYVVDRNAPYVMARGQSDPSHLVADDVRAPVVEESRVAALLGLDTEVKLVKTSRLDLKGYVDYSRLITTGGDGFSVGSLLRVNVGGNTDDKRLHAFRVRAEAGAFHARYAPGYFDMFYEIQKYHLVEGGTNGLELPKLRFLDTQTGGYRPGGRIEATYAIVPGPGLSVAYQGSAEGRDSQLLLHVEVPTGQHLRLLATYVRNNPLNGQTLLNLEDPDALLMAKAKLRLLPFIFLNAEVSRMYQLRMADNAESSELVPGAEAVFQNRMTMAVETEIGFEF